MALTWIGQRLRVRASFEYHLFPSVVCASPVNRYAMGASDGAALRGFPSRGLQLQKSWWERPWWGMKQGWCLLHMSPIVRAQRRKLLSQPHRKTNSCSMDLPRTDMVLWIDRSPFCRCLASERSPASQPCPTRQTYTRSRTRTPAMRTAKEISWPLSRANFKFRTNSRPLRQ